MHVARPLRRAHAHHVALRALGPAAAALASESSRTSSHSCSVSSSSPSRSRTTASITRGSTGCGGRRARRRRGRAPSARSLRRRACGRLRDEGVEHLAFEPRERAFEQRPARALSRLDSIEHRDRRDAPREVLRERLLLGGEQAHREAALVAHQLVRLRVEPDRDRDERRIERHRHERADRDPERTAEREHRDTRGKATHRRAQVVAARHAAYVSWGGRASSRRRADAARRSRSGRARGCTCREPTTPSTRRASRRAR